MSARAEKPERVMSSRKPLTRAKWLIQRRQSLRNSLRLNQASTRKALMSRRSLLLKMVRRMLRMTAPVFRQLGFQ